MLFSEFKEEVWKLIVVVRKSQKWMAYCRERQNSAVESKETGFGAYGVHW